MQLVKPHALRLSEREHWAERSAWSGLYEVCGAPLVAQTIREFMGHPNRQPSLTDLLLAGYQTRGQFLACQERPRDFRWRYSLLAPALRRYSSLAPLLRLFSHVPEKAEREMYLGEEANELRQETSAFYSVAAMRLMVRSINKEERETNGVLNEDHDLVFPLEERPYWRNMPASPPAVLSLHSDAFMTREHYNLLVRGVPEKPLRYLQTYDEIGVRPPAQPLKSAFHAVGTLEHAYPLEHHAGLYHWGYESGGGPARMEIDFEARTIVIRPRIPLRNAASGVA